MLACKLLDLNSIPERRSRPHLRRSALVLLGAGNLGAERMRRTPTPMGIVKHGACERDHVGLALGDDRLSLFRRGDQPDRARRDAGLALHLFGETDIGVGDQVGRASALIPPAETQTKSTPAVFSTRAKAAASSGVRPPSTQSFPVIRAPSGMLRGITARTACAISSG